MKNEVRAMFSTSDILNHQNFMKILKVNVFKKK